MGQMSRFEAIGPVVLVLASNKPNTTSISGSSGGATTPQPKHQEKTTKKAESPFEDIFQNEGCWSIFDDDDEKDIFVAGAKDAQRRLEGRAISFRYPIYYGPDDEERTCIWGGGSFSWYQKTSGISWICINGTDAVCAVALNEKPVPPSGRTYQLNSSQVLFTALSDMGVWADTSTPSTEFRRKMMDQSRSKEVGPFAVVSAAPRTDAEDCLGSSHGALPAKNFLREKLNGHSALTHCEIRQIAVCSLKLMLGSKFDPNRIVVLRSGKQDNSKFGASEIQELLSL